MRRLSPPRWRCSAAEASAQTKGTATKAEVQAIQAQMQALAERLNRLEATNAELQTENSELQALVDRRDAEMDYLKSQTKELREEGAVASNEISKVKGADWATKIKFEGDLRFRHEKHLVRSAPSAARPKMPPTVIGSASARAWLRRKVTDNVKGTLLLATGGDDPRSSNQTLGGNGSRKAIGLDLAYADWKFMQGGNLLLGKSSNPSAGPARACSTTATSTPKAARSSSTAACSSAAPTAGGSRRTSTRIRPARTPTRPCFGLQGGLKFPLFGGETVIAANYYDCGSCQGKSPLFNNNANGNTTFRWHEHHATG